MHVVAESEREIVPLKDSNKDERSAAESLEGSERVKENDPAPRTVRAQQRAAVSPRLEGLRQAARRQATGKFTSLLQQLTPELLTSSFYSLKRQAAVGVDGVRWREYETGLTDRVIDLHDRVRRGGA